MGHDLYVLVLCYLKVFVVKHSLHELICMDLFTGTNIKNSRN